MSDLSKIRARLAALRAKTTANGCTEAEAVAAAEKAAELLDAYGLTEADAEIPIFDELAVEIGARRTPIDGIWGTVAAFARCTGFLRRAGNRWTYVYFGRDADVLVAEYVHEVVANSARTAADAFRRSEDYSRRRKAKTRARAMKAFLEGFAFSIVRKIVNGLWKRLDRQAPGRAGELISANELSLKDELARRGVSLSTAPAIAKAKGQSFLGARSAGVVAGHDVSIEAGLTAEGQPLGGLLT